MRLRGGPSELDFLWRRFTLTKSSDDAEDDAEPDAVDAIVVAILRSSAVNIDVPPGFQEQAFHEEWEDCEPKRVRKYP